MADSLDKPKGFMIKPKVLTGFIIILLFSASSIIVTYQGFKELNLTRQEIGQPGQKLALINRLISEVYGGEADVRMFIITNDTGYLESFEERKKKVTSVLNSLDGLMAETPGQQQNVKQIKALLSRKWAIVNELLALRKTYTDDRFYEEALKQIERAGTESRIRASVAKTTTVTTTLHDTVVTLENKDENLFGKIKRFFVGPERVDTVSRSVNIETRLDTIDKGQYVSDSIINNLVKLINGIRADQRKYQFDLGVKEAELLEQDRELMKKIESIVSSLERQELSSSIRQSVLAQDLVNRSIIKILALGSFTFILLLVLLAVIFRDISRSNQYRTQLLEAKQYAERLLRVKEQFLANISHEIRTPLSAVIGLTHQLGKTDLNARQQDYVSTLSSSADHLLSVINDILDYSKLESGQVRFETAMFDPVSATESVIQTFTPKVEEKQLLIHTNIDPAVPHVLWGDSFRLKQALMNLLSNAIKFTESGSIIVSLGVVRLTPEYVKLQFTVADTGVGIPPEQQQAIFEEFTQADSSISRKYGGTGLGLTLVKKIVELQGGEISLESKINEGTIVKFSIPYALTGVETKEETLERSSFAIPNNTAILVIDDDEVNLLIVTEMATTLGLQVDTLSKPEALYETLSSKKYSAILTDIQMPGLNGYEVVKLVEQFNENIPVVAITANSMVDSPEHFTSHGFAGYLIKPFVETDLQKVLSPLIGIPKPVKQLQVSTKSRRSSPAQIDLSDLYRFTGGDKNSLRLILTSFLDNTYRNADELNRYIREKNLKQASEVAHRMKSAFSQLKIYHISSLLQKIETLKPDKYRAANIYLDYLNKQIKPVVKEIRELLEKL
jgi:signal transduction histidine kinase/CheY-like chemotaxis protein/HPt (histidine-containing phosphotransfer) domain-containing protein